MVLVLVTVTTIWSSQCSSLLCFPFYPRPLSLPLLISPSKLFPCLLHFSSLQWTHFSSHSLQPLQCLPHQHQNLRFTLPRKTMRWNISLIQATARNQCSLLNLLWANLRWSGIMPKTLDYTATTPTTSRLAINLVSLLLHLPWLPESTALTSLSSLLETLQMGQHLLTILKRTFPSLYMVSVNSSIKNSLHSFPHLISLVCSPLFSMLSLPLPSLSFPNHLSVVFCMQLTWRPTWSKYSAINCYWLILLCLCSSKSICQLSQCSNEHLQWHHSLYDFTTHPPFSSLFSTSALHTFHTCMLLIRFVIPSNLQYRGCLF